MDQHSQGFNMEEFFLQMAKNVTFKDDNCQDYNFQCGSCQKSYLVNKVVRMRCDQCYPHFCVCENCFTSNSFSHDSSHKFMGTNDTKLNASRASPVMFGKGGGTPPIIPYTPVLDSRIREGIEFFRRDDFENCLQKMQQVSRICNLFPSQHNYKESKCVSSCWIGEIKRMRGDYSGGLKELKIGLKLCAENEKKKNTLYFCEEMEKTRLTILFHVSQLLFNIGKMEVGLKKLTQSSRLAKKLNLPIFFDCKLFECKVRILILEKEKSFEILESLNQVIRNDHRYMLAKLQWLLTWEKEKEQEQVDKIRNQLVKSVLVENEEGKVIKSSWKAEVLRYSDKESDIRSSVEIFCNLKMVFMMNLSRISLGKFLMENDKKEEEGRLVLEKALEFFRVVKNGVLEERVSKILKK